MTCLGPKALGLEGIAIRSTCFTSMEVDGGDYTVMLSRDHAEQVLLFQPRLARLHDLASSPLPSHVLDIDRAAVRRYAQPCLCQSALILPRRAVNTMLSTCPLLSTQLESYFSISVRQI